MTLPPPTHANYLTVDEESALVLRAKSGDKDALDTLLDRAQYPLYGMAWQMLRHPQDAADVTQNTLIKGMHHISKFDMRARWLSWAMRVLINEIYSLKRKEKRRYTQSLNQTLDNSELSIEHLIEDYRELSPIQSVLQEERDELLYKSLELLPDAQKSILLLRDAKSLEYEDIAVALDIPLGTVKSRLFRARLALRKKFQQVAYQTETSDI